MLFIIGFFVGALTFKIILDIDAKLDAYKDRKQLEFEAAVQAEAEHRARQLNKLSDSGWSHVEPTDNPRHPSNVRPIPAPSDPYTFDDDPFGMLK